MDLMSLIGSPLLVTKYVYFTSFMHSSSGFGILSLQFVLVPWASSTKQVMLMATLHDVRGDSSVMFGDPVVISSEVSTVCNLFVLDLVGDTGSSPRLVSAAEEWVPILANMVKSTVRPRQRVTFIVQ